MFGSYAVFGQRRAEPEEGRGRRLFRCGGSADRAQSCVVLRVMGWYGAGVVSWWLPGVVVAKEHSYPKKGY